MMAKITPPKFPEAPVRPEIIPIYRVSDIFVQYRAGVRGAYRLHADGHVGQDQNWPRCQHP